MKDNAPDQQLKRKRALVESGELTGTYKNEVCAGEIVLP